MMFPILVADAKITHEFHLIQNNWNAYAVQTKHLTLNYVLYKTYCSG